MRKRAWRIIPSMPASPTFERLRPHARRHHLKPAKIITDSEIKDLLHAIQTVQISPRLPADVLSDLRSFVKKVGKRLKYIEQWKARTSAKLHVIQWQRDAGLRLAQTRDLNNQLAWLLNRRAHRNRNLYAMAQGKRTLAKLGVEHYRRIGKLGAQVRWQREHVEQTGCPSSAHAKIP
jgi:hypothetical protein